MFTIPRERILKQEERFILTKMKRGDFRITDIMSQKDIHVHFNKESAASSFMNIVIRDHKFPISSYFRKCMERSPNTR